MHLVANWWMIWYFTASDVYLVLQHLIHIHRTLNKSKAPSTRFYQNIMIFFIKPSTWSFELILCLSLHLFPPHTDRTYIQIWTHGHSVYSYYTILYFLVKELSLWFFSPVVSQVLLFNNDVFIFHLRWKAEHYHKEVFRWRNPRNEMHSFNVQICQSGWFV